MDGAEQSHKTTESVRLCLTLLIGMSYGSRQIREQVRTTATCRAHWPKDLATLLEAVETEDGAAAGEWFVKKGITLPTGRLADAITEYLLDYHRHETARQAVWTMCRRAQLPPGELLSGLRHLVAELEAAGIQASERKDA